MKRIVRLFIIVLLLFSSFLYFYLRPKNYELTYDLDNFKITEQYVKNQKQYYFTIANEDHNFNFTINAKYTKERKLINKINEEEVGEAFCIKPESKIAIYPVCEENTELISYYALATEENNNILENYEKINIYDFLDKTFVLWNYHNFLYLNKKNTDAYVINNNDLYNLKLVYATNRYLLIPNQEDEFTFNKIFIIDAKKNKIKEYKLAKEIYFDSYYLGDYKDKVYLVDRKNSQEYEINLKNGKLTKTEGKILKNNKWEKLTINKLVNNDYAFEQKELINYSLENNELYALINDTKIKITNQKVSTIVKSQDLDLYYLSEDSLYYFNLYTGAKKLMSYSEWNFNYDNMIYIFD